MDNNADLLIQQPIGQVLGRYPGVKLQSCEKWRCGSDDTERTLRKISESVRKYKNRAEKHGRTLRSRRYCKN